MHNCTMSSCPAVIDQLNDIAAAGIHTCERCDQWDPAGLVAIDPVIQIVNLDMTNAVVSVCHACASIVLDRSN